MNSMKTEIKININKDSSTPIKHKIGNVYMYGDDLYMLTLNSARLGETTKPYISLVGLKGGNRWCSGITPQGRDWIQTWEIDESDFSKISNEQPLQFKLVKKVTINAE